MKKQSMRFKLDQEREVPGLGLFKPGNVVDYDEKLFKTRLFEMVNQPKEQSKEGFSEAQERSDK